MEDSHLRSLVKAVSWRLFGTFITMVVTFLITHKINFAIYVGIFEFVAKILLFYLHERIWSLIPIGRKSHATPKSLGLNNEIA